MFHQKISQKKFFSQIINAITSNDDFLKIIWLLYKQNIRLAGETSISFNPFKININQLSNLTEINGSRFKPITEELSPGFVMLKEVNRWKCKYKYRYYNIKFLLNFFSPSNSIGLNLIIWSIVIFEHS